MNSDKVETVDTSEQPDEFVIDDLEMNQEIEGGRTPIRVDDVTLKRGVF